jgi:hypothetical protein
LEEEFQAAYAAVKQEGRDPFFLDKIAENKLEIKAKKDTIEALEF